ncbi:GNAT family N-acetyltransferase [Pseudoalteromonas sp. SMS1]|uniref:GNAT family N-acetyltransferase n=1 Tax=Pseudoalteromonas sp. SMS1 TaxID=2908894 RepID=UPI001F250D73|nr:GNAT family N-acetyltransferase [Pseudoalteromonas sp. SMS1]MCF2856199.1 GNAT family N-acetyltransferase [Pseudoalteromonas sp. SMS1]
MNTLFSTPRLDFYCCKSLLCRPGNAHYITSILSARTTAFLPKDWQTSPEADKAFKWLNEKLLDSEIFIALPRNTLSNNAKTLNAPPLGLFIAHIEQATAHIGYLIHAPFWQQGYGSELLSGCIDYFRTHALAKTIYAGVAPNNQGSIRALQRCHFTLVSQGNQDTNAFYQLQL